mgnify:CR=1 FL=1
MRKTMKIKLTKEYKEKALNLIDKTIDKVADKFNYELSNKEKSIIKNLSLDQINVNVTSRAKLKTMWVFDTEEYLPVIVEKEHDYGMLSSNTEEGTYLMNPNLSWTFNKANIKKGGISYEEFENKVLELLLEDFETASFYGTLSYVSEGGDDEYNV